MDSGGRNARHPHAHWAALVAASVAAWGCAATPLPTPGTPLTGYWREAQGPCGDGLSSGCASVLLSHIGLEPGELGDSLESRVAESLFLLWSSEAGSEIDCEDEVEVLAGWPTVPMWAMCEYLDGFGQGSIASRMYDRTAFAIRDVESSFSFQYDNGTLGVPDYAEDEGLAAVSLAIVHEAAHSVAPPHISCGGTRRNCDEDFDGAYGIEAAYGALILHECDTRHGTDEPARVACREVFRSATYSALGNITTWDRRREERK